jgi:hypothetical protein
MIRYCTSFAFGLTLAGSALARRPPALAEAQDASAAIAATCPEVAGAGYRDALSRFHDERAASREAAVGHRALVQRMADHVVLTCKAGQLHAGGGYRDMVARFQTEGPELPIEQMTALRSDPSRASR